MAKFHKLITRTFDESVDLLHPHLITERWTIQLPENKRNTQILGFTFVTACIMDVSIGGLAI